MITGYKPSGYILEADGHTVRGETRQCVHCQYTWEYQPGSGAVRGWCMQHRGLVCGRPECAAQQRRILASFPDKTRSCMNWADVVERQRDRYDKDPRYEVLPSGIVVAKA